MNIDISQAKSAYQYNKTPTIKEGISQDDAKLREQTDAFEAVFVKHLLDIALTSDSGLFPQEVGREIYMSMYKETMSEALSGEFGFSQLLFDYLTEKRTPVHK